MSDEIEPHAQPIPHSGQPAWFPSSQDDAVMAERPEPSGVQRIVHDRDGIRPIWLMLLFIGAVLLFRATVLPAMFHHGLVPGSDAEKNGGEIPPGFVLVLDGVILAFVLLCTWILSRLERRPFGHYGLGSLRGRASQFGGGLFWGIALLALQVGAIAMSHGIHFDGLRLHGAAALCWGGAWALAFLLVALMEETLLRGFLQFTLGRGLARLAGVFGSDETRRKAVGFWIGGVILSMLFGLGHGSNPGESPIGLFSAALIGLVFLFSLWRTGSLWWAVGYHAAWDWAQSFLFGVRDSGTLSAHRLLQTEVQGPVLISGGLTGPEGSVYVLVAVALTVAVIALTLKPQPGSPSAQR